MQIKILKSDLILENLFSLEKTRNIGASFLERASQGSLRMAERNVDCEAK